MQILVHFFQALGKGPEALLILSALKEYPIAEKKINNHKKPKVIHSDLFCSADETYLPHLIYNIHLVVIAILEVTDSLSVF